MAAPLNDEAKVLCLAIWPIVESLLSSEESSSSDDEAEEFLYVMERATTRQKIPRIVNYLTKTVALYNDKQFVGDFRLGRGVVSDLILRFSNSPFYSGHAKQGGGHHPVSAERYILVFLSYLANEGSKMSSTAKTFNMSEYSVDRAITCVSGFLCLLAKEVIKWPSREEADDIEKEFRKKKGIPNVIGCVDGTHFRINTPSQDKDSYYNRKSYFSLHMQGICDHEKKFLDVCIGYPGSVHDSRVFQESSIFTRLPTLCQGRYLLGDTGYPISTYCMIPYKDNGHLTAEEKNFNVKHSGTRIAIEHVYGILRQRFRYLLHINNKSLQRNVSLILSACVLHNLADLQDLAHLPDFDPQAYDNDPNECRNTADPCRAEQSITTRRNLGKELRKKVSAELMLQH